MPLYAVYVALKSRSFRSKKAALIAFATLYGGSIVLFNADSEASTDGAIHLNRLQDYYMEASAGELVEWTQNIILQELNENGTQDFYIHILFIIIGTFLKAPWLLFYVVAYVYSYFFAGSFMALLRKVQGMPTSLVISLLLFSFFFVKGYTGIHSIRNWTAMWLCVYTLLRYWETGRRKYIYYLLLAPLIHFSYFVIAIPFAVVMIFKSRPRLYFALFLVSNGLVSINALDVSSLLGSLGADSTLSVSKAESYYVEGSDELVTSITDQINEGYSLHRTLRKAAFHRIPTNAILILLAVAGGYLRNKKLGSSYLISVSLLMMFLSNTFSSFTSLTTRTLIIAMVVLFAGLIFLYRDNYQLYKKPFFATGLKLLLLGFVPYFIYELSSLIQFMNLHMLIGAPFLSHLMNESNVSVLQFLKGLI